MSCHTSYGLCFCKREIVVLRSVAPSLPSQLLKGELRGGGVCWLCNTLRPTVTERKLWRYNNAETKEKLQAQSYHFETNGK